MSDNEQTTSQELFNHLYQGCNILRGPINQDEFKSYVTPILFFKRISDVYDEKTKKALVETEGDEELAKEPEYHSFVIPNGCHWNDVREKSENVGKAIVERIVEDIDNIVKIVRFDGWQNTTTGQKEIRKSLRSIVWIKYKIKDNDVFEKAYSYVEQYY